MAVRLQTAEGEIKEYDTVYGVGTPIGGEVTGPDKWIAKCGTEWYKKPEPYQECDHLECAIYKAEHWDLYIWIGTLFVAFAAISLVLQHFSVIFSATISFVLSAIFVFLSISLFVWGHLEKKSFGRAKRIQE